MMVIQVPESSLWSQKRKKCWGERVQKKTVHPHFPSFFQSLCVSENLLSLDETQRLLRRKAPASLRPPHTDLFTGAGRWSHKLNAQTLSPNVCVCVCVYTPHSCNLWLLLPTLNQKGMWPPNEAESYWSGTQQVFPGNTHYAQKR